MSKNNQSSYELVFITKEDKEDIFKKINQNITENGGNIDKQDAWGKKTFAYPIKKLSSGHYFAWNIKIPQNNLKTLEKNLRFNEDILRYLLSKIK